MIGRTVSHYQVLEKLGVGGMGVVYRARDLKLERDVVLKFLPAVLKADEEATRRQIREAKAASALDHPNICTIYGLEETDDGQAFISMAFYPGRVLRDRIDIGPLAIEDAVDIARQAARGLAAAHAKGIVHRDVKPANIVVTEAGVVKILDFGVAALAGAGRITQSGTTVGTAAYMSPEQLRGHAVDGRMDVWSLGAVLHEMVTGRTPFHAGKPTAVIQSILTDEPKPMKSLRPETPGALERVVRKSLVKDAAGRYPDMKAMLDDLEALGGPSAARDGSSGWTRPTVRRARRAWRLAAAVAAAGLLAGGGVLWQRGRSARVRASADPAGDPGRSSAMAGVRRLAVLPFSNLSGDPASDYLAFALADRITERLGYVKEIVVRSASAGRDTPSRGVDAAAVGAKLRVDYLLTGGFSGDQKNVRLSLELVNVRTGEKIPQEPVEVRTEDSFRLQEIAAEKVTRGLALELSQDDRRRMRTDVPGNPLAYQYYLRSLSHPHGYAGSELAFPLLEKCIALDPGYAPAWAALGERRETAAVYALGGAPKVKEAEQAFSKALSLNGRLLDALSGLARLYTDVGQPDKAIGLLRTALEINPNHADTHFALSYITRYAGMLDESAREGELALSLDPDNPRYRSLATTYLYLGNLERSLEVHRVDPDSGWTQARIGQIFLRRGQKERALEHFERAIAKEPESSSGIWARAMKAAAHGRHEEGLAILRKSNESGMVDGEQRYHFANIHCLLGDRAGCLLGLQAAVDGGFFNYPFLTRDTFLDPVRKDPAFQRILAEARAKHEAFKARFFPAAAEPQGANRRAEPAARMGYIASVDWVRGRRHGFLRRGQNGRAAVHNIGAACRESPRRAQSC